MTIGDVDDRRLALAGGREVKSPPHPDHETQAYGMCAR